MKRFHRVLRWIGIILAPLLLYALVPNLTINLVNRFGARILLTSAQLRAALSWMDPPQEVVPAVAHEEDTTRAKSR